MENAIQMSANMPSIGLASQEIDFKFEYFAKTKHFLHDENDSRVLNVKIYENLIAMK